jgi:dTDP-4-dehydrorhamnose 3,5-epimerase
MEVFKTHIEGVCLLFPKVFTDGRGFFMETFNQRNYSGIGIQEEFVQDNFSRSGKHVLRGIHLQEPHSQGKLVRVAQGRVFDVAVDLRKDSPTFGSWYGAVLDDQDYRQLWIPAGCGHAFLTLSETVDFEYKCTDFYHPESEVTIKWDDPELNIQWPIYDDVIISAKDEKGISFSEFKDLY